VLTCRRFVLRLVVLHFPYSWQPACRSPLHHTTSHEEMRQSAANISLQTVGAVLAFGRIDDMSWICAYAAAAADCHAGTLSVTLSRCRSLRKCSSTAADPSLMSNVSVFEMVVAWKCKVHMAVTWMPSPSWWVGANMSWHGRMSNGRPDSIDILVRYPRLATGVRDKTEGSSLHESMLRSTLPALFQATPRAAKL
jgi:hypothetical protein